MQKISVLPENVRNVIAAGEVVERPASVVKELVENSIDAGASEIDVSVVEGGLKEIVVADDGCGMTADDLRLSVERHATSKLTEIDDLEKIGTMGFRGEALPSIAAVSKMTIETRLNSGEVLSGNLLKIDGGRIISEEEAGLPAGTKITIEDLFFNVPARKKFAKQPRTELGHIKDIIERLALANPEIRFSLKSDGRELFAAHSVGDQKERSREVFGSDAVKNMYGCLEDLGEIRIYGLVGDPSLAGKKGVYWFVNRRPIRNRSLNHAISEAYRSLLPRGVNPFSMLFIDIDPSMVDVNVHPTKSEVKFLKGNAVHDFVVSSVKKALGTTPSPLGGEGRGEGENISTLNGGASHREEDKGRRGDPENLINYTGLLHRSASRNDFDNSLLWRDGEPARHASPLAGEAGGGEYSSIRSIGQLHNSYLLCEKSDGALVVIDQHAAHERIGYERLKSGYESRTVESQRLLMPEVVEVPSRAVGYFETALENLNKIGWEIEYFGGDNFCVKAVPAIVGDINLKNVVVQMAETITDFGRVEKVDDRIDSLLKLTSCHRQVRAGDRLTDSEIRHLLREMDEFDWSGRCPHGRPAVAEISLADIGKWFDR